MRGTFFEGPYNKVYSTSGSTPGSYNLGKLPSRQQAYGRMMLGPG